MFSRTTFLALALIASASSANAAVTYTTTDVWDGVSYASPWGPLDAATYGQVINAAKSSNKLNSFDFYVNTYGKPINFIAEVYEWDGTNKQAMNGALFSSPVLTVNSNSLQDVHIGTGITTLNTGADYVLLFTVNGVVQTASNASAALGWVSNNYDFEGFAYSGKASVNAPWDALDSTSSLAFTAKFNSTPDTTFNGAEVNAPGPLSGAGLPVLLGMMGMGLWRRRA